MPSPRFPALRFFILSAALHTAACATAPASTPPAATPDAKALTITVDYFQLFNASASDVAQAVNAHFATAPQIRPATPAHSYPGLVADSDPRTNTVVTAGTAQLVAQAHALIAAMEADAAKTLLTLAADAAVKAFDQRYGIRFLGEPMPASLSMNLPEKASAREAITFLQTALSRDQNNYRLDEVAGSNRKIYLLSLADKPTSRPLSH